MLLVGQSPDLHMRSRVENSLFLCSPQHVMNEQFPGSFDLGASKHGAQLDDIEAEAVQVFPFFLGRDGETWEGEHHADASCLSVCSPILGLLLALVTQKAKQGRDDWQHGQAGG